MTNKKSVYAVEQKCKAGGNGKLEYIFRLSAAKQIFVFFFKLRKEQFLF